MKKKILALALVIAIAAIAVVGGSLAWFMDEDEATNVFTMGSIEIEQLEQQREVGTDGNYTGALVDFEDGKLLLPVISNDTPDDDPNYQDKIVTVKNVGKNGAFVQTFIAVPKALDETGVLRLDTNVGTAGDTWAAPVAVGTVTEDKIADGGNAALQYNIYKFVYNTTLASGASTSAVLDGVYIDAAADMNVSYDDDGNAVTAYFVMNGKTVTDFNATGKLNIYVATQAIQAQGFTASGEALANFAAHPWAE